MSCAVIFLGSDPRNMIAQLTVDQVLLLSRENRPPRVRSVPSNNLHRRKPSFPLPRVPRPRLQSGESQASPFPTFPFRAGFFTFGDSASYQHAASVRTS